jgi:hypothetical protein
MIHPDHSNSLVVGARHPREEDDDDDDPMDFAVAAVVG